MFQETFQQQEALCLVSPTSVYTAVSGCGRVCPGRWKMSSSWILTAAATTIPSQIAHPQTSRKLNDQP